MRTSNPAFNSDTFSGFGYVDQTMTVYGTVNKSVLLLLLSVISASIVWALPSLSGIGSVAKIQQDRRAGGGVREPLCDARVQFPADASGAA